MLLELLIARPALAQVPSYPAKELDQLVGRVALFPDPLLAQVLAASTFADQIPDAAHWADQNRNLTAEPLAQAMQAHQLSWDPTVQSLLPFPFVLDVMASNMGWTTKLGKALLVQQQDVITAVQRERGFAKDAGYLNSNEHVAIGLKPYVTITPIDPAHIFVPSYDPDVVFSKQRTSLQASDEVRFDHEVTVGGFEPLGWSMKKFEVIGGYFQAWGWGRGGIDWNARTVIINHASWRRSWVNQHYYVHPYPDLQHIMSPQ